MCFIKHNRALIGASISELYTSKSLVHHSIFSTYNHSIFGTHNHFIVGMLMDFGHYD